MPRSKFVGHQMPNIIIIIFYHMTHHSIMYTQYILHTTAVSWPTQPNTILAAKRIDFLLQ